MLLGFAAAMLVVFVVAPGRLRRAAALVVVLAPVAFASPWLLNVSDQGSIDNLSSWPPHVAALMLIAGSVASGLIWWQLTRLAEDLRWDSMRQVRLAWGIALAVVAAVVSVAALANAPRITDRARTQYHAFLDLGAGPASAQATRNRLVSGSGARYDYWRIAFKGWRDRPLAGLGAGGYSLPYFQERRTSETIRQPHSIELQVLAELGLVGGLLLAALLAAVAWGLSRALRRRLDGPDRHLLVAGAGLFTAWLVQTSVDWLHLLPGLTGMALIGVAVLVRHDASSAPAVASAPRETSRMTPMRRVALACAGLAVLGGLLSLSRQALSEHYRTRAQESLSRGDAADALALADRSLRIDGGAIDAYYLRSAALGQLERPVAARRALRVALRREPENFVTWALLGDLEDRESRPVAARSAYRRASELNPRDVELGQLARGAQPPERGRAQYSSIGVRRRRMTSPARPPSASAATARPAMTTPALDRPTTTRSDRRSQARPCRLTAGLRRRPASWSSRSSRSWPSSSAWPGSSSWSPVGRSPPAQAWAWPSPSASSSSDRARNRAGSRTPWMTDRRRRSRRAPAQERRSA